MVVFAYLLLCLCWSTTWQAIRLCLLGYPPLIGAAIRFLLATLLLAAVHVLAKRVFRSPKGTAKPAPQELPKPIGRGPHLALCLAGIFNGLGYACIYLAEQTLSGGATAVLCATSPFFSLILARLFGLEPLLISRLAGMLLGFFGVALLFADGLALSQAHFQAMLLAGLAAAILWPLYGVLLKRYVQNVPPLLSTCYFLFYTGLILLLLSLWRREPLSVLRLAPAAAHFGLLYLTVIGSVLAWTLYIWLLQRLDLSVLSALGLVQPLVALGLDLLFHEAQLQPRGYMGAALVMGGMALSMLRSQKGKHPSPSGHDPSV